VSFVKNMFGSFPVPVDPDRPDGDHRMVDGGLIVSEVFRISDHLATLRQAATASDTEESYNNVSKTAGPQPRGDIGEIEFDPVRQGSVIHLLQANVFYESWRTTAIAEVAVWLFRNSATPDNYIGAVSYGYPAAQQYANGKLPFEQPIALQAGERIVAGAYWADAGISDPQTLWVSLYYREFSKGPQTLDPA